MSERFKRPGVARDERVRFLLASRNAVHADCVRAIGTRAFRELTERLGMINEELVELGAIPGLPA
jgi:hypothetical protein